jgi:hypothetical protein
VGVKVKNFPFFIQKINAPTNCVNSFHPHARNALQQRPPRRWKTEEEEEEEEEGSVVASALRKGQAVVCLAPRKKP